MLFPKVSVKAVCAVALASVALGGLACGQASEPDTSLAGQVGRAERILIGAPTQDYDVAAGEPILVEIRRVFRGAGAKGKQARLFNGGDEGQHPRYQKGTEYLFLLTRSADNKGWVMMGSAETPVEDDQITIVDGGERKTVSLDELEDLVASRPFTPDAGPARDTLAGKWFLVMSRRGSDFYIWLLDVKQDGQGTWQAKLLETQKSFGASALKSFDVEEDNVHIVLSGDDDTFDFRGTLRDGALRGSVLVGGEVVIAARMAPAEAGASVKKYATPPSTTGREELIDAAEQDEPFVPLSKFVRRYPDSPLALDAYQDLISLAKSQDATAEQFTKLAEDYQATARKWGTRFEQRALFELGVTLSRTDFLADSAMGYLDAAERSFNDETPPFWKTRISIERGKRMLLGDRPEEGLAMLTNLHEKHPFEAEVTWLLARQAEQDKQIDKALALYGELAALPSMEQEVVQAVSFTGKKLPRDQLPGRVLQRLWKEKHGDTEGLAAFVDELYERSLRGIASDPVAPRKASDGTRVVLCELFTGAKCPPCLGADAATTALEAAFQKSEVIVLRYHEHVNGPDPLANKETEQRFEMYGGEGTPMLFINGRSLENVGGGMAQVPELYRRMRETVEPYLAEKVGIKIDLSAQASNGKIAIAAKAGGIKSFGEDVHLRLALAEDRIPYVADNGIRVHEMIVRMMPGTPEGVSSRKGQLAFKGEVDIAKLKSNLAFYLSSLEQEVGAPLDDKPLDFRALHVVAFLQDDDTQEILQATAVPVTGTLAAAATTPARASGKTARAKAPAGASN